jgi:hypothetical protein
MPAKTESCKPRRGSRGLLPALCALWITAPGVTAAAGDPPEYELTVRDARFAPETIEVPAGTKFRLVIRNHGPGATEFEMKSPPKERIVAPGTQAVLLFAPLKPGTYPFVDEFHEDTGKGRIVAR